MKINTNYRSLEESYLFSRIAEKVAAYQEKHPQADIIRLGIGDVTLPLSTPVADALEAGAAEQADAAHFHGYGPEQGYPFLREAIRGYYAAFGVDIAADDIFVSDGAKSDLGNILDLFDTDNTVLIPDPVYPVYQPHGGTADRVSRRQPGQRLSAAARPDTAGRYPLYLLAEQPDRRRV